MLTINELCEKLSEQVDEITMMECLELTTEELVESFKDRVEEKYHLLITLIELDEEDD